MTATAQIIVRNPRTRYVINVAEPDWLPALNFLSCDPEIAGPEPAYAKLDVRPSGPFVQLCEAGAAPRNFASAVDLREHLHIRLFRESVEGPDPVLHAACLTYQGRRILLAGPKTAGKSTLSLALALAGFAIEGDENIFATASGVIARPRSCRIKHGSLQILPELGPLAAAAPFTEDWLGQKIYSLPPSAFGTAWRIGQGAADLVILLHANHGGMSSIRPVPPLLVTQALMAETAFPAKSKGAGIAQIIAITRTAPGFDLSVGHLGQAVACIKSVLPA